VKRVNENFGNKNLAEGMVQELVGRADPNPAMKAIFMSDAEILRV
jgi:hypothetical protein